MTGGGGDHQFIFIDNTSIPFFLSLIYLSLTGAYIAGGLRPYSTVELPEFIDLMKTLDPKYTVPGRTTITQTVIPNIYEDIRASLVNDLSKAASCSLTTGKI